MDEYTKEDKKGRKIIIRLIESKGGMAEEAGDKESVDVFATGLTTAAIEVKRRNYTSKQIEDLGGNYIMKSKYDRLIKYKAKYDKVLFSAIYTDYIYVWDITDMDFNWTSSLLPNATVEDKGDSEQEHSYLHIKDAVKRYKTEKYLV